LFLQDTLDFDELLRHHIGTVDTGISLIRVFTFASKDLAAGDPRSSREMADAGLKLPLGPGAVVLDGMQRRFFFSWKCAMCDSKKFWGPDNERIEFVKAAGPIPSLDPAMGPRIFECGALCEKALRPELSEEEVQEELAGELEKFMRLAETNAQ
jgi:hypothetical protein